MNTLQKAEVGTAQVPHYFTSEELRAIASELTLGVRCVTERLETLRWGRNLVSSSFPCWSLLEKVKEVEKYVCEMAEALELAEEWEGK